MQIGRGQGGSLSNSKDKKRRNPHRQPASASLPENSDADGINHENSYSDAGYMMPYDNVSQWPNNIPWHHQNCGMTRVFPAFAMQNYVYPNANQMIYGKHPPAPRYIRRTRPPLPYPFSIYEQQQEQGVGNAFHHLLSDDNVGACTYRN
ncbi:hypothetical protein OWV82_000610 [Melia azedarach]|uniref:Uncharacterized protein n=1 Tax=Melia azedarach TaxID=155640 RepID=A0ACC1YWH5_MELAZ|nr:hypothetical protein OWV82_000610 [Melia azedarach]